MGGKGVPPPPSQSAQVCAQVFFGGRKWQSSGLSIKRMNQRPGDKDICQMIHNTILTMMEIVMTSFRRAASILVLVLVLNVMKLMMTTMMGVRWWRWRTTMVMMGVRCGLPTVSIQSGRLHTGKRQRCWVHHPQYILTIYKQYIQNIYTHNILYTLNNIESIYHIFTIFSRRDALFPVIVFGILT